MNVFFQALSQGPRPAIGRMPTAQTPAFFEIWAQKKKTGFAALFDSEINKRGWFIMIDFAK
jgi:hypothetical protein